MRKYLLSTIALSSILTTPTIIQAPQEVSAASYKISKGKLVNSKTGKVVTSTVVYKNTLYVKGKRSTTTTLFKNTLYVKGKVKKGIVQYKGKFYKSGKLASKNTAFVYKEKLYKGQKLYAGFKKFFDPEFERQLLFKNGKHFTGVYKNTIHEDGADLEQYNGNLPRYNNSTIFEADGTSMTYYFIRPTYEGASFNVNDVTISGGAKIESVQKSVEQTQDLNIYAIKITNIEKNTKYDLKINHVKVGKLGSINFSGSIYSYDSKLDSAKSYQRANELFKKYGAYTPAQMGKITSKEHDLLSDFTSGNTGPTVSKMENQAIEAITSLLSIKLSYSPYFGELGL